MKKLITLLLACCMVFTMIPLSVSAEETETATEGTCGENLTWRVNTADQELYIMGTGSMETDLAGAPWAPLSNDIKWVYIDEGVTSISPLAFDSHSNISYVSLPSTLDTIGAAAFGSCTGLTWISIPENVSEIGDYAFSSTGLTNITFQGYAPAIGENSFAGVTATVGYPEGYGWTEDMLQNYGGTLTWESYSVRASGKVNDDVSWVLGLDGTMTFSGSGSCRFEAWTSDGQPWYGYRQNIKKVVLESGITGIGDYCFSYCSNLTSVELPEGIKYIGGFAFSGCTSLTEITLPASLERDPEYFPSGLDIMAFADCTSLQKITFCGSAPSIEWNTFRNVTATVYYPADDETWTEDVMQNYEGTLTWVAAEKEIPNGWVQEDGVWYYYVDGDVQTGWLQQGETWYYLEADGAMATGWVQVGNNWYYMNTNGAMQTGWLQEGGKWYYLNANGTMATGWAQVGNNWYYMNTSGIMQTGWLKESGKWYYLQSNGAMATGWVKVDSDWYYMNAGGDMHTGWLQEGELWYYLKPDGRMATGKYWMNNRYYTFTDSGVWIS